MSAWRTKLRAKSGSRKVQASSKSVWLSEKLWWNLCLTSGSSGNWSYRLIQINNRLSKVIVKYIIAETKFPGPYWFNQRIFLLFRRNRNCIVSSASRIVCKYTKSLQIGGGSTFILRKIVLGYISKAMYFRQK